MNREPAWLKVARWEFGRFFKVKELFWAVVIILAIFLGQKIVTEKIRADDASLSIAVLGDLDLPPSMPGGERFVFVTLDAPEDELRAGVLRGDHDGLLIPVGPDAADLVVRREVAWRTDLATLLSAARQIRLVGESGLPPDFLARLAEPFELRTELATGDAVTPRGAKITVAILVGLMLMGIFLGNSYLFVAITGEKTQRITEQILVAVKPQDWIDGKILGLAALSMVHVAFNVLGYVLYRVSCMVFWKEGLGLPTLLSDPALLLPILILIALGFYFWFCFFGLVASTISDPNSSSRSSFLMLPVAPLGAAFVGFNHPDAPWMKILSWLPVSSPSAMPARLVLGEPAWWEVVLSILLLAGGIWLLRRAAGAVFGLSMLMYGKEPGVGEMWRWVREGD